MTVRGETIEVSFVVLLSGIEIRVYEGIAIGVSPSIYKFRVFPAPALQTLLLLAVRCASVSVFRNDSRLEMIR
jgi:hypothetical protein